MEVLAEAREDRLRRLIRGRLGDDADVFTAAELTGLVSSGWDTERALEHACEEDLLCAGLRAGHARILSTAFRDLRARAAAGERGLASAAGAEPELKKVKMEETPSALAADPAWHRYAYHPTSYISASGSLDRAAFFGFRPEASPPANIPPELVSPVFSGILKAVAEPAQPPPDLSSKTDLHATVGKLLTICSALYKNEEQLQNAFLDWYNTDLGAGTLTKPASSTSGSQRAPSNKHDGMYSVICDGKDFVVTVLGCKSDVGSGEPLVRALAHYQNHYKGGSLWESDDNYSANPLPALVLLLEGPRLSIHAVWTIYQNRVGYAPLTPSYYLANDRWNTANMWKLLAVLTAFKEAVPELVDAYRAQCSLTGDALKRMARLRKAAQIVEDDGKRAPRPCTLPYSLLDEQLGLSDIAFRGPPPCLIYTALQRIDGGAERRVLVKFVEGRYGEEVHTAWHAAGVAPKLYCVQPVGGSMFMVVMELLSSEEGWMPLGKALGGGSEPLKQAVRSALHKAHAAPVGLSGYKAVHGDMRCPNIMVQNEGSGAAGPKVFIIDYDWAGRSGEATYPLVVLASGPKWHTGVRPGGIMQQEHDSYLLARELGDQQ